MDGAGPGHSRLVDDAAATFTARADFYELLYGRRPDEPGSSAPAKPRRAVRIEAVPAGLRRICATAIAVDPAARHPTARKLADELDEWLLTSQHRTIRVRSLIAASIGVAVVLCLVGIAWPILVFRAISQLNCPDQPPVSRLRGLAAEADRKGWLVGSYNSKVYHRPDCVHVKLMAEHNQRHLQERGRGGRRWPCAMRIIRVRTRQICGDGARKLVRSSRLLLA